MTQTLLIAGASRGIGLEMAAQASKRGDRLIALVRGAGSEGPLEGLASQILIAGVTDEDALNQAAAELTNDLDLLVCNAGVYRGRGGIDAEDMTADAWSETLMTNVAGPFFVTRAFLSRMKSPGKIAIVSSKMGSSARAPGGSYSYRSSKAAANNLACNLASELRPRDIAVGSYHPGWVRTDMGGSSADISAEESAAGLIERFDALSLETTGCFEFYSGEPIPF